MDKHEFGAVITVMGSAFAGKLTAETIETYYRFLKDFHLSDIQAAVHDLIESGEQEFIPKIATVINKVLELRNPYPGFEDFIISVGEATHLESIDSKLLHPIVAKLFKVYTPFALGQMNDYQLELHLRRYYNAQVREWKQCALKLKPYKISERLEFVFKPKNQIGTGDNHPIGFLQAPGTSDDKRNQAGDKDN